MNSRNSMSLMVLLLSINLYSYCINIFLNYIITITILFLSKLGSAIKNYPKICLNNKQLIELYSPISGR